MKEQGQYLRREYGDRSSILTTWMISFKKVASESEGAANLLKLWGFLDRKDLWHGLFASFYVRNDYIEVPKWLAVLAESELEFNSVIGLLRRYSLSSTWRANRQRATLSMRCCMHGAITTPWVTSRGACSYSP
jgi:hypothetical protein